MMRIVLILVFLLVEDSSARIRPQANPHKSGDYPNELPGFELFKDAPWKTIRPFETAREDVPWILGDSYLDYNWNGVDWHMVIFYLGENGSCNDRHWPDSLTGKVANITLFPKSRIDFSEKAFPKAFKKSSVWASHADVQWDAYSDINGLRYEVYRGSSSDGKIYEGDLRAISYGPSEKIYKEKTGCD